ncbi:MAG: PaaI family thioesterase [Sulfitobacter sp.]|nr:PaaI family thioesterase [Sulfitobacter sp.]
MTPETAQATLNAYFAPWVNALEPRVTEIGPERTVLEIPINDNILRVGGIASGQAMAALADTAMVFACFGALDGMEPLGTVTLDTQFLRPASGERIRAEAEVIRMGKAMIFTRCTLIEEPSGKAVVHATATFAR